MDDPNITMEEYIRLEKEKAQRHGRTFNWQTATFEKVKNYDDEDGCFIDFETEFPAIVFDNTLTSNTPLPSEPTVCPPNENKIDFRISLDESDDEDYTVIFDENSFSYKIIYVNDLKTDSGNDNGKNNMPSSPKPTVDYFDDLDFFKDFKNEFPAIVYNDAQTSKPDLLTKLILNPQHINEFDLNDETSLSEHDEEEQNVLYSNDLFPFNIIHPDDLKSEKDKDDNDIDITPLPHRDLRHPWLRYYVDGYDEGIVHSYEKRLKMIWSRPVNRLGGIRRRMSWRRFILALGLHTEQEMAEAGFEVYWDGSDRLIPDKGDLRDYWIKISSNIDFLGPAPSYVLIRDPVRRLCHRMIAYNISGWGQAPEKYLFRQAEERKSGARLSRGHFIGRLAMHFGLGPERQQVAAAGLAADEGAQEIPVLAQAPSPPPPAPLAVGTMSIED
ncbi:hypothetical protein Tco_1030050 [Tanacetum coccineum]|uniref:Uncharacterized protein n=1 Tax=Tanacetum coccineum TaxID=301880 RepID=A0ABQ5G596_9ASTR